MSAASIASETEQFEGSLAASESSLGPDHPVTIAARATLAGARETTGRIAEALALAEANLASVERTFGAGQPEMPAARFDVVRLLPDAGRATEAVAQAGNSRPIRKLPSGPATWTY
jgi:hypothetical protein